MIWVKKSMGLLLIGFILFMYPIDKLWSGGSKKENASIKLRKTLGREHRKEGIHDGNNVLTIFFNYGDIGNWWGDADRLQTGIYPKGSGHSYFAEFTPFVGAEVRDRYNITRHIFSDGLGDVGRADMSPQGYQWGFEPIPGYADEDQDYIAMSDARDDDGPDKIPNSGDDDGKPDSWPWVWPDRPDWIDPRSGVPFWSGQYGAYSRADQESYFRMNDYFNDEFQFWPDPDDSSKRGLAIEVEVRGYQWADPAAEDIIIFTYWVNNTGKYTYERTVFGMYGDADVGEQQDNSDDLSEFNKDDDIVYQWDSNLWSNADGGFKPAYFGWKFLESPGDPLDGEDNDGDGLPGADGNPWDESQEDRIDNDMDWDPTIDDVGTDGKGPSHPEYPGPDHDGTEGNGVPDPGEPNFEYTDNDESDQIGLTSFASVDWKLQTIYLADDELTWQQTVPGTFTKPEQLVDIVMHYGSAYFKLPPRPDPNSRRKFAISMVMGMDRDDLIRNAKTMQQIYDKDYNFARPPLKPNVKAVAGDGKVTLYWDKFAERSRDPIYGYDFEGYVIYRATDPGFIENNIITDTYGNPSFNKPVAQFDLVDGLKGPHPIGLDGVQFNMGNDEGLQYVFVDSGQTWAGPIENGQLYFYAVCSYDKGYDKDFYERGLSEIENLLPHAPAICSKRIQFDATGVVTFLDVNTVMVTPNAPAAGFIQPPNLKVENQMVRRLSGTATGEIVVEPMDPLRIPVDGKYQITFNDTSHIEPPDTTFYVMDLRVYTDTVAVDTNFVLLNHKNIVPSSLSVLSLDDPSKIFQIDVDYEVGFELGNIRAIKGGGLPYQDGDNIHYMAVSYQFYPIVDSPYINGEGANEFFDGLRLFVHNDELEVSRQRSHWLVGDSLQHYMAQYGLIGPDDQIPDRNQKTPNFRFEVQRYPGNGIKVPYDFHIVFYDSIVSKSANNKYCNFRIFNITTDDTADFAFFDVNKDSLVNDQDVISPTTLVNNRKTPTWQVKFWQPEDIIITRDSLDAAGEPVTKDGDTLRIIVDTVFVEKIAPKPGDIFYMAVDKPFSSNDVFEFNTNSYNFYLSKEEVEHRSELDDVAVVPNPYVVTASWEPKHFYTSGRGIRKIDFIHLPPRCTIKIFTLRGYLVDTIEHDSYVTDGSESWDLVSKDGMEIAYGVYFYHVSTPSGDKRIGKFAVIK
ncbi:MAG: hypothetical protein AMS23_00825 [Bacteroides sp. SM1_62]|nr:MAG: hypothetical protein AMS26_11685 [Bacteroides sp. SM23_62]KPL26669.1 MAG: hypothetical protein AMS23_00825 [Bacteroides sp. SM1_62]